MPYINIIIFLSLILWPINLFLNNTLSDFFSYTLPVIFLSLSLVSPFFILLIGIVETKLILLPIIFSLINKKWLILILSLVGFLFQFQNFKGQTIFIPDYEAQQTILRNTYLYPNIPMARVFQNKVRVYLNKFSYNFFALTDPNNYFFGMHPGQITLTNQNLYKYSFAALPFFIYGLYHINKSKFRKFIITSFLAGVLSLSLLTNFDRNDFILWFPISLTIIHGINLSFKKNIKLGITLSIFLIIFTIFEISKSYVEKIL